MFSRFRVFWVETLSYTQRKAVVILFVLLAAALAMFFMEGSKPYDVCLFVNNTPYELMYFNSPVSYVSTTHKVIWRKNGCGNNIEDMYAITTVSDQIAACTVTQIEKNGGPFFELVLPEHYEQFCPEKPKNVTPIAR